MSEQTLTITSLNDFIFCPVSIYFHNIDHNADNMTFQCGDQLNGKAAHETVDNSTYSTRSDSERILNNIITDINNKFVKKFDQSDSVYIFKMSSTCEIYKFGYAKNEDDSLLIV